MIDRPGTVITNVMSLEVKRIPTDIRSLIRFFAFYIGNGTLGAVFDEFPDYDSLLDRESFLPSLVAVFVNKLDLGDVKTVGPAQRCAWQYVKSQLSAKFIPNAEYNSINTDPNHHDDYRRDICKFACHLATNAIPRSQENGVDYWTSGSGLESLFAVYCNVAELDSDTRVSNHDFACGRVDLIVDSDDGVLDDWETELY